MRPQKRKVYVREHPGKREISRQEAVDLIRLHRSGKGGRRICRAMDIGAIMLDFNYTDSDTLLMRASE